VAENRKTFVPMGAKYDGEKYEMRVLIIVRKSTVVQGIKDQAVEGYEEWKYRCARINHDTTCSCHQLHPDAHPLNRKLGESHSR